MTTMTRHRGRRSWQQIIVCAGAAALASINTIIIGIWAIHIGNDVIFVLGEVVFAVAAILAICYAGTWTLVSAFHHARNLFLGVVAANYTPPAHSEPTGTDHADYNPDAPDPAVVRSDAHEADHWARTGEMPPQSVYMPRLWMPSSVSADAEPDGAGFQTATSL